ncbi:MAG: hypothetical protein ACRD2C_26380 [Acidimicrobiales bacterium]
MSTSRPPQADEPRRGAESRRPGDDSGHVLRFTPPPADWVPPDEAGRAILRVAMAVKKRRDPDRKDAA